MGLFTRNFDKPGPGVSPDAPRKKGAARFFEILGRDFSTIWLAGILAMLGGLPFAAGVWFAVETHSLVPLVIAGVLGGMIAAPQIVGLNDTILRTLRDEPGYWWETYRRTWKRNLKESLLPGAVCGLLLAMEIFSLCHINIASGQMVALDPTANDFPLFCEPEAAKAAMQKQLENGTLPADIEWKVYRVYGSWADLATPHEDGVYLLNKPSQLIDWVE